MLAEIPVNRVNIQITCSSGVAPKHGKVDSVSHKDHALENFNLSPTKIHLAKQSNLSISGTKSTQLLEYQ